MSGKESSYNHFNLYIKNLLKQVHRDTGISSQALRQVDKFVHVIGNSLSKKAIQLVRDNKRKTVTDKVMSSATKLVLPGGLAKYGVSEGMRHVSKEGKDFLFPSSRVKRVFLNNKGVRVGSNAAVFLAGVIEYLVAEMLELSGNSARDHTRKRINVQDLSDAVNNDEELSRLFKHNKIEFEGGAVVPHIHAKLLPKKKNKNLSQEF